MKKKETIPVLLKMTSIIEGQEITEPMQLLCRGELRKTPSGYLLRYEESLPVDDNDIQKNDVILSMSENRVSMSRPGEYGTTMIFVKEQRFEGEYHTPYGEMSMAIFPTHVYCNANETDGRVHLEYQLDLQGRYASMNTIDIEYHALEEA